MTIEIEEEKVMQYRAMSQGMQVASKSLDRARKQDSSLDLPIS
jgi:hypothetical protein